MKIFRGRNFLSNGVLEVKVGAKGEDERGVEVRQSAVQRGAAQRIITRSTHIEPPQLNASWRHVSQKAHS